jgi:glucose/arabinose dehydrogenase
MCARVVVLRCAGALSYGLIRDPTRGLPGSTKTIRANLQPRKPPGPRRRKKMTARITLVTALLLHSTVWAATPLTTQRVATGLSSPLAVVAPPGDTERVFIVEQNSATIKIMDVSTGVINATPFLVVSDVRSSGFEQGLLGLAFHPNYASNRQFFVNYTSNSLGGDTVIARYTVSADPDIANNDKDVILIIDQFASNHNGGGLGSAPSMNTCILPPATAGASAIRAKKPRTSTCSRARCCASTWDGDDFPLDGNKDYAIPPDNPFASGAGADEVFDYGLRNPYRCGFDRLTGDLYIGGRGAGSSRRGVVSRRRRTRRIEFRLGTAWKARIARAFRRAVASRRGAPATVRS